jgi:hypothetical protein
MSLLRLLTAGKCLIGNQEPGGRYRLTHPAALPKFEAKKNLFRTSTAPAAEPEKAERACPQRAASGEQRPNSRPPQADSGALTTDAHERRASAGGQQAKAVPVAQARTWVGVSAARIQSWLGRSPKPARSAVPKFTKPLVQGELSLDTIKVVRNDLSDSDLEVVPARPAAPLALAKIVPAAKAPGHVPIPAAARLGGAAEAAWERVSARLFGAGKT